MSIKVIVMDIDGTLVDIKGNITKKTKETLLKVQEKGIKLVLASGRPINGLLNIAKELKMDENHGLCISFNGAKVYDIQTMEVLYNKTMTIDEGRRVLHHMKNFKVRPIIVKDDYAYVEDVYDSMIQLNGKEFNIVQHETHDNNYLLCEVKDLESFATFPLNKILTVGEIDYMRENYKAMAEPFEDELNSMFTSPYFYEFTAKGIDKVQALDTIMKKEGYEKSEIIAFGDAQNDITMIKYAGVGVAMGNASEEVKRIADEITDDCDKDGIANSLYKHIDNID